MSDDDGYVQVGQTIDNLGVVMRIEEDDMLTDVLVIAKIVDSEGGVRLGLGGSDGMSWIERFGMLATAYEADKPGAGHIYGDDDE